MSVKASKQKHTVADAAVSVQHFTLINTVIFLFTLVAQTLGIIQKFNFAVLSPVSGNMAKYQSDKTLKTAEDFAKGGIQKRGDSS